MGNDNVRQKKFNSKEKNIILSKTGGVCAYCGKKLISEDMTIDHIFPVDKGGLNDEYNLIALCKDCNNDKSNFVYRFSDYYKYILPEEQFLLQEYNYYAMSDYMKKSIIGYDIVIFRFVPLKYRKMVSNMLKRGAGKKKAKEMMKKVSISVSLSRAYPADADEIYKLICKNKDMVKSSPNNLYQSPYEVLDDIKSGCVYTLQKNKKICGAFLYKQAGRKGGKL